MAAVVVRFGSGSKPAQTRLIIVVGRSVSKKAAVRNKLKRRIRAIARPFLSKGDAKATVIVRPEAATTSYGTLKRELEEKLFKQRR